MRGARAGWLGASLAVVALFAAACADDDDATPSESSDVPVSETTASIESTTTDSAVEDPGPSTTGVHDSVDGSSTPWELEQSMPGDLGQVVTWSAGFAGIMDLDGAETLDGGEVWYSPDGIEWSERLDGPGPGDDVFTLVGHQGGLFALSGGWLEWDEDKTLWNRPADGSWRAVVSDPRLESLAVAGDRLFAYAQNGFDVVGVFDTVTLEQVDYGGLPEVELASAGNDGDDGSFRPMLYQGRAIGLDEGFLAQVSWLTGSSAESSVSQWRLFYSEDASTWIEHPNPPTGLPILPYSVSSAPVYEGVNLLDDSGGSTGAWLTETGFDFERTSVPGSAGVDSTALGFVTVDDFGEIHISTDGSTWTSPTAPPTWNVVPGEPGFADGTIVATDGQLLAIGVHGEFRGFIGPVDPTTEIWSSTVDALTTDDR